MAGYFYDSSAFAKAYRLEGGSQKVIGLLTETGQRQLISSLTVVEFQSVFAQKVRAGFLTLDEYQLVRRRFGVDLRTKRVQVQALLRRHQRNAERLIIRHSPTRRLRTLDALQLAIALELAFAGVAATFVVADVSLAEVARIEGLQVINPNDWP